MASIKWLLGILGQGLMILAPFAIGALVTDDLIDAMLVGLGLWVAEVFIYCRIADYFTDTSPHDF